MPYLSTKYKRYATGGWTAEKQSSMESGLGIASAATGLISGLAKADRFGRKPAGVSALTGAASGAQMGSALGPIGAVAGGVLGGATSLIKNLMEKKANERAAQIESMAIDRDQRESSAAALATNPSLMYGNAGAGYYANGGPLSAGYISRNVQGGKLVPLSSDTVEAQGNTHEEGGIQLPEHQAEVENGETINRGFVFSEKLGFAAESRKLSKAIGKIESKGAMNPQRVEAINRMEERHENLKLSQEYMKQHFLTPQS